MLNIQIRIHAHGDKFQWQVQAEDCPTSVGISTDIATAVLVMNQTLQRIIWDKLQGQIYQAVLDRQRETGDELVRLMAATLQPIEMTPEQEAQWGAEVMKALEDSPSGQRLTQNMVDYVRVHNSEPSRGKEYLQTVIDEAERCKEDGIVLPTLEEPKSSECYSRHAENYQHVPDWTTTQIEIDEQGAHRLVVYCENCGNKGTMGLLTRPGEPIVTW